jgi:hypothetical protein
MLDISYLSALTGRMSSIIQLSPKQLRQAAAIKEKIVALQKQLEQLSGSDTKSAGAPAPVRKKRKLSPAARAKIVAAQKARWAKYNAAKKAAKK